MAVRNNGSAVRAFGVLFACGVLVCALPARADHAALVSWSGDGGESVDARATATIARELAILEGTSLLDRDALRKRLHGRGLVSADEEAPPSLQPEAMRGLADELLRAVAFGYDDETVVRGDVVLQDYRHHIRRLPDSEVVAAAVTDICLYVVRALEHRGDEERARLRARECWQLVPDLAPSPQQHPDAIRELVRSEKTAAPPGLLSLAVDGQRGQCRLRVQGRPFSWPEGALELPAGNYAVRIDCARRGFVHQVQLRSGQTTVLEVHVGLEQSIALDETGIALSSALPGDRARQQTLVRLAGWLGVTRLWVVEPTARGVRITRHRLDAQRLELAAQTTVELEPDGSLRPRLSRALAALHCAPSCPKAADREAADRLPSWVGVATTAAGSAAVLGSWVLYANAADVQDELNGLGVSDAQYQSKLDKRDSLTLGATILSAGGSAALVVGEALLLPAQQGIPWWAYAGGGAGLVLAGVGASLWSDNGSLETIDCIEAEECLRRRTRVPLGPMLVTQGAALASLPVIYALRMLGRDEDRLRLNVGPGELGLRYRGHFS